MSLFAVACGDDAGDVDATLVDGQVLGPDASTPDAPIPDSAPEDRDASIPDSAVDAGPTCATCDADNDGFDADDDCDDSDSQIYPGVHNSCSGVCGEGTRLCGPDGAWSDCDCEPVCEASGSGRCFYISAVGGSDANAGSFDAPWATYLNIVSYYTSDDAPASAVRLGPGDVVYFMDGNYNASYSYDGESKALFLRGLNGEAGQPITLRAYPGQNPLLTTGDDRRAVVLLQSNHLVMDGFEIRDARNNGIRLDGANNIELSRLHITDIIGPSASNVAGITVQSSESLNLHHSRIHDIIAEGSGGNVFSHGVILFRGGNSRLHHNEFYTTPPRMEPMNRACVLYKHTADIDAGGFEVDHNIFRGCERHSVGSGTHHTHVHHNLFLGAGVLFQNFGGPTRFVDNRVANNTFVNTTGVSYSPSDADGEIGLTTFSQNIVVDSGTYDGEHGMATIGTYSSDEVFRQTVDAENLTFSGNCYFNPAEELRFNLFAASGSYGDLGGIYTFAEWQALGYDTDSVVAGPELDGTYSPTNAECAAAGWRAP